MYTPDFYYTVMGFMGVLAFVVFFALMRINAGYGIMYNPKWGPAVPNVIGWVAMELPAFAVMVLLWAFSARGAEVGACVCASLFSLHYFQRTFVFPLLMRGRGKMPLVIILMGMVFNAINAYLIGGWLFYMAPATQYRADWLLDPRFICGTVVFLAGMAVNIHSDHIVRCLRKPGDTRHYIPRGGMFRYVSSANYFGEFTEWAGFAILTWSLAGAVFALWTFANLAPRARALHARYCNEFGDEFRSLRRRYILPFIY